MAGGRFLSGDDPTISPDARVRASVGVGNDCEPYADFGYLIAPPGVVLPNCSTVDRVLALGDPSVYRPIFDRIYTGTPQVVVTSIGDLERYNLGLPAIVPKMTTMIDPTDMGGLAALQRAIESRCGADLVCQQNERDALQFISAVQAKGGMMSSAQFFGLGAPGFASLPTNFGGLSAGGFGLPGFTPGASFFPQLGDALGGALPQLATIAGNFFLQQQAAKQQEDLLKRQLEIARVLAMGPAMGMNPAMALGFGQNDPLGAILGGMRAGGTTGLAGCVPGVDPGCVGPSWTNGGGIAPSGGCGPRGSVTVSPADAAGIYRQACNGIQTRGRFFALRQDGTRDLFVRVGKVQSVSPRALTRFARRWSKAAGLTAVKRGAGGRSRRRPR